MYSVGVRDHFMVAHSLRGDVFGIAQALHGVTYCLTVEVERQELGHCGIVIDMGLLRERVRAVVSGLHYRNLDEHPAFQESGSTSEHIARYIHRELAVGLAELSGAFLSVTLEESPVAFARYRAPIASPEHSEAAGSS